MIDCLINLLIKVKQCRNKNKHYAVLEFEDVHLRAAKWANCTLHEYLWGLDKLRKCKLQGLYLNEYNK